MRIDHLIFAVPELGDGVAKLEARFGVRAAGGGQHVGQGTHNKLLAQKSLRDGSRPLVRC